MIKQVSPQKIQQLIESKETFIVNVVASWCSDCTKQASHIDSFADLFSSINIHVFQINVQDQRNQFLSSEHKALTNQFGGHGFPRTILIKKGRIIDADNVEVIENDQLLQLAEKFQQQL